MKLGIVGTRNPKISYLEFSEIVKSFNPSEIVSGGAKGIDTYAENYARFNNIPFTKFAPEYDKYGSLAPIIRNTSIVQYSDKVIAFPSKESRGTRDSIRKAEKYNKLLKVYEI